MPKRPLKQISVVGASLFAHLRQRANDGGMNFFTIFVDGIVLTTVWGKEGHTSVSKKDTFESYELCKDAAPKKQQEKEGQGLFSCANDSNIGSFFEPPAKHNGKGAGEKETVELI